MALATIKVVFRKDKLNDKGIAPINLRITKDRKVTYITTGISIQKQHWDVERNCITRKHLNSVRLNNILKTIETKVTDKVLDIEGKNLKIDFGQLKNLITTDERICFFEVGRSLTESYKVKGNIGTFAKASSILRKLQKFANTDVLPFDAINVKFLTEYQIFAIKEWKNCTNTVNKDLKFIRTVFNYAIRQDIVPDTINPFKKIKINNEPTNRGFLTSKEIQLIEDFYGSKLEELCRDVCLFQYYSGGIRISDVLMFRWENIVDNRLNWQIRKTGKFASHLLNKECLTILEKHRKITATELIFFFKEGTNDLVSAIEIDNYISCYTALINKYLKIIAAKVGINKKVSTHMFRHSFATNALAKGIGIEVLKEVLHHSNIRETQIYAKMQSSIVDTALEMFGD